MINNISISQRAITKLLENNEKLIFRISKEMTILEANETFRPYIDKFQSLKDLLTYTHITMFSKHIESLNEKNSLISFVTNFSFDKEDVEDIPISYKVVMEYFNDDNIIVLADPQPYLTHEDTKAYFSMVNDFSTMTRDLKKTMRMLESKDEELRNSNANLEKRVKEELEKNIKQYQKFIKNEKFATLGVMIGNIIHQWNQPLSSIGMDLANIRLGIELDGSIEPEELLTHVKTIEEAITRLNDITTTFRNFSNINKQLQRVSIQDTIKKALVIMKALLSDHNTELICDCDIENIETRLVPTELQEVIVNLLKNSHDAFVENGIKNSWIKVFLSRKNDKVIISIEDNAGGIPNELLTKVFNPYFTTKEEGYGTGIGLSMSKQIVESLNGSIEVFSTSVGTIFTITLPIISDE